MSTSRIRASVVIFAIFCQPVIYTAAIIVNGICSLIDEAVVLLSRGLYSIATMSIAGKLIKTCFYVYFLLAQLMNINVTVD